MNFKDYQSKGFVFDNELNHVDSENIKGKSSEFKSIFQGKYKVQNDSIIITKGSDKRRMYVLSISAKRLVLKIKSSNRILTFV
ncbi:MAG: lipocalin family protein, partial [Fluviicola sp.]